MNGIINIIKGGLRQQVSEEAYEKLYKPNGWAVDCAFEAKIDEEQEVIKTLKTQGEIKNYNKMRKTAPKKFNDNLFEDEEC
jgi:predicted small metal-binding protein